MSLLLGPAGTRLAEIEEASKKRFFLVPKEGAHADHAAVLAEGKIADLQPPAPIEEGTEVELKLLELDKHDAGSAVGKLDGVDVVVAKAARLVGKKAKVRVERVLGGVAYATALTGVETPPEPITFESEAEKPTRAPSRTKKAAEAEAAVEVEEAGQVEEHDEADLEEPVEETGEAELEQDDEAEAGAEDVVSVDGAAPPKKKTRRGSRGGRNRKKKPATIGEEAGTTETGEESQAATAADEETGAERPSPAAPRIHVPDFELGDEKPARRQRAPKPVAEAREPETPEEVVDAVAEDTGDADAAPPKKKTRRGSRGGRNRKKPAAAAASDDGAQPEAEAVAEEPQVRAQTATNGGEPASDEYVPMSEWLDDLDA
jgi:hypothetical protein